ncbi:hypothetical protein [Treponema sp.]|uniref:YfaP family protein n=1 Tax=Treponema sp. TaxID=166 RepID=UPI0025DA36EC|nr:hypothetical protein [Treponema sp.]MCR5217116.1 hypothetical protein [Treponema sp.]
MKKLFLLSLCLLISASLMAEDLYICVASFLVRESAESTAKSLNEENLETIISQYKKTISNEEMTFYRVLVKGQCSSQEDIEEFKNQLYSSKTVKRLKLKDFWRCKDINPVEAENKAAPVEEKTEEPAPLTEEPVEEVPPEITPEEEVPPVKDLPQLSIRDSDSGEPVADANVNIDQTWDLVTGEEGLAPLPEEIEDGEHSLTVTKDGEYLPGKSTINIDEGKITDSPQLSLPKKVDYERIKIILDWGFEPEDLDCHVICGKHHVFFGNKSEYGIRLDRDDATGYGPETITIKEAKADEKYEFYIQDFSNMGKHDSEELSYSGASVKVYFNNEEDCKVFKIKKGQAGTIWHVFDISNKNQIEVIDEVSSDSFIDKFLLRTSERNEILKQMKEEQKDAGEKKDNMEETVMEEKPEEDYPAEKVEAVEVKEEDTVIEENSVKNENPEDESENTLNKTEEAKNEVPLIEDEGDSVVKYEALPSEDALTVYEEEVPVLSTEAEVEYKLLSTPGNVK